ncbi:MAG: hypothetical protein JRJ49_00295 [Deltaproteobacteria bacterium]|nr:hypothetical protein [Deltaproteobacteria bacterium]
MRLLIFLSLIYLCYILLKSRWKSSGKKSAINKEMEKTADDIMIYDPCCKIYYPKKNCIAFKDKDKILYFCGKECKNKFLEDRKKGDFK